MHFAYVMFMLSQSFKTKMSIAEQETYCTGPARRGLRTQRRGYRFQRGMHEHCGMCLVHYAGLRWCAKRRLHRRSYYDGAESTSASAKSQAARQDVIGRVRDVRAKCINHNRCETVISQDENQNGNK